MKKQNNDLKQRLRSNAGKKTTLNSLTLYICTTQPLTDRCDVNGPTAPSAACQDNCRQEVVSTINVGAGLDECVLAFVNFLNVRSVMG